jgi:hypothetical protein
MADLVTLSMVEGWLGLPAGNADEANLAMLISAVSAATESYCSRTFAQATYTETRDGTGGARMSFANVPVTAVSGVTIDGETIPASGGAPTPGYLFSSTALTLIGYRFTRSLSNVVLSYTAGYVTTPLDLAQAVLDWISHVYKEQDRIGMVSKAVAGETTMFLIKDMPPRVATMLAPWKRVVPV